MVAASTTPTSAPSTDPPQTDSSRRHPMGFQQGLSGLSAASKNLEVIGNNVANSNTYGEKSSRTEFADMYAGAMTGAAGNPLDLAINGNGFFQTQTPSNQTDYTRNGQFKVSNTGNIINDQGNKL